MTAPAARRSAPRVPPSARRRARVAALQMLYQAEVGRAPIDEVRQAFWAQPPEDADPLDEPLRDLASALAAGAAAAAAEADPLIVGAMEHWRLDRLQVMDRLILRLAVHELLHHPDTPAAVVIDEALELARTFSGEASVRFVNGVLDAIRRTLDRA